MTLPLGHHAELDALRSDDQAREVVASVVGQSRIILQQFAGHYIKNMRWHVVPLIGKACFDDDWHQRTYDVRHFNGNGNIGIRSTDGLVVFDDDFPTPAVACADAFLPSTGAVFGRPSRPRVKRLYYCPNLAQTFSLSQHDLASCHIEIHGNSGAGLRINICRGRRSLVELGWNRNGAWPRQSTSIGFDGLERCDEEALSRCVRTFLRKHDLVDHEGRSMLELDKEIEILMTVIGALGEAIAVEDWTYARRMWDVLAPFHPMLIAQDPTLAHVETVLRHNEALACQQVGGIH